MSADIARCMADVAQRLLGSPNEPLSTETELRYGRRGSLSINVRKGVFKDWETNEGGGVLALIRRELPLDPGAWLRSEKIVLPEQRETRAELEKQDEEAKRKRRLYRDRAIRRWREAEPASGTLVEVYLRSRGIMLPVPPTLRFHPALYHGDSGQRWPAMVGVVTRDREIVGILRTWLAWDGSGKAPVSRPKMALGPIRGGAVRLGPMQPRIYVAEGIETALSVMRNGRTAWATLGISGMHNVAVPPEVQEVVICADAGNEGETAARKAADRIMGLGLGGHREAAAGLRRLQRHAAGGAPWMSGPPTTR